MIIGICGSGAMGSGIAISTIQAGFSAIVFDVNAEVRTKSKNFIEKFFSKAVEKGKISDEKAKNTINRLVFCDDVANFAKCDFVIEAIIENKAVKQEIFSRIEEIVSDDCIIASNTSSLSITSLASAIKKNERFVGMHFFNPAHILPLVEVIRGVQTSNEAVENTVEFAKKLGKSPVIAKDVPGFIVNRVARNFYNEAMRIAMENVASIEQIDSIVKGAGMRMGPFELMDFIGNDVNFEVTRSMWEQYFYEPRFAPSPMQQQLVEAKLFGRKTGRGFYSYEEKL